jgi:uncharacterized membrane protein YhiD involved in acid resistance
LRFGKLVYWKYTERALLYKYKIKDWGALQRHYLKNLLKEHKKKVASAAFIAAIVLITPALRTYIEKRKEIESHSKETHSKDKESDKEESKEVKEDLVETNEEDQDVEEDEEVDIKVLKFPTGISEITAEDVDSLEKDHKVKSNVWIKNEEKFELDAVIKSAHPSYTKLDELVSTLSKNIYSIEVKAYTKGEIFYNLGVCYSIGGQIFLTCHHLFKRADISKSTITIGQRHSDDHPVDIFVENLTLTADLICPLPHLDLMAFVVVGAPSQNSW